MELKKNPKVDLENKKTMFLEIGLVVALALVIIAFSISQRERVIDTTGMVNETMTEVDLVEITEEKPQEVEPVKQTVSIITDILNVVDNQTKIETTIDFLGFDDVIDISTFDFGEEVIEEAAIYINVEEMPTFQGGDLNAFRSWVNTRIKYPPMATEMNISGTVVVEFVVEPDGSVGRFNVLQTPDKILSDEAIRVIRSSPKWKPGKQRGQAVRVKYTLPIQFKLSN